MLNHARCLLMNVNGIDGLNGFPGQELLDPIYRPIEPPDAVIAVRQILFGTNPDATLLNYRTRQLLQLLHASPLDDYVRALDPRITYLPFGDDLTEAYQSTIENGFGSANANLYLRGKPGPLGPSGRMRLVWQIDVSGNAGTVREVSALQTTAFSLTFASGRSQAVMLPGSNLTFAVADGAPQLWTVTAYLTPAKDLTAIAAALARIGEPVLDALFGAGPAEPYKTFANLWYEKLELGPKLGGLLCAVLGRMEERRRGIS